MESNKGFTLVEIIVSISILFLIGGAVVDVFLSSSKSTSIVFDQLSAQGQSRKALQDFVNEMRSANYSSIGTYPLEKTSSTEIIFYSNIDSDPFVERVRYSLVNNKLLKGITKPSGNPLQYLTSSEATSTVVENLNNGLTPLFHYYDENRTSTQKIPMTHPVNSVQVRMVEMNLRIDKNPELSPTAFIIQAEAEPRSLKTN